MSEIVIILGAGASRNLGGPLMDDFLQIAKTLLRSGRCEGYEQDFKRVFDARDALQQVHPKAKLGLDNLEEVFGAFEMANLLKQLPGTDADAIDQVSVSMKRLITKTLEESVLNPLPKVKGNDPYIKFGKIIKELNSKTRRAAVITFNYDVVIDVAFHTAGVPFDYCLTGDTTIATRLLKLHGSLNWTKCSKPDCRAIVPWSCDRYFERWPPDATEEESGKVQIATRIPSAILHHCSIVVDNEPVIVPPIWNKTEHHHGLASVWHTAAQELRDAEQIFVIGFSLPPTDTFFKYLYALSTVSTHRLERFCVLDPNQEVHNRFRELMGLDITHSNKFSGLRVEFPAAVNQIEEMLITKAIGKRA